MFVFPIMGWMIIHIPWFGPWHISCSLIPVCTCSWISSLPKFGHGSSRPALQAWTPLFVAVAGRFKPTWGTVRIAGASGKPPEWKIRRENGEFRAEKTKLGRWERCFNYFNVTINHKQWLHICKWSLCSMPPKSIHCWCPWELIWDWESMNPTGFGSLALLEDETGGYVGSTNDFYHFWPTTEKTWIQLAVLTTDSSRGLCLLSSVESV